MPVASPYALFRASDHPWRSLAAVPAPACARKRPLPAAVIQGELFAFQPALLMQPKVLPLKPRARPGRSSKPIQAAGAQAGRAPSRSTVSSASP